MHPKKLMPWPCQQKELSSPSLELIFSFPFTFLTVTSSQVLSHGPMFYPWSWIDAKNRFHCCETSPNTRLKYPHNAVFASLWANAAPILRTIFSSPNFQSICDVQHFLKCLLFFSRRSFSESGSLRYLVPAVEVEIIDIDPTAEAEEVKEAVRSCLQKEPTTEVNDDEEAF